jgi:UDP-N-acetylmuramoylalanine--D-glutamate ligase
VALLVGGTIAAAVGGVRRGDAHGAPSAIITMGQNGPRIHRLLHAVAAGRFALAPRRISPMPMRQAAALGGDGVVLLSPGAPSFGPYRDYVARGRHFAQLAALIPTRSARFRVGHR